MVTNGTAIMAAKLIHNPVLCVCVTCTISQSDCAVVCVQIVRDM